MRAWAAEAAKIPDWLFQESYDAVGDIAETIAVLLPPPDRSSDLPLSRLDREPPDPAARPERGRPARGHARRLAELDDRQRFVWNKLISGGFRVGVSQQLVTRALGEVGGHRRGGRGSPADGRLGAVACVLRRSCSRTTRPTPTSAAPIRSSWPMPSRSARSARRPIAEWQAEWKWDGIRSQLIRRGGQTFLWSRGEELVTERYPELAAVGDALPDGTVIDGEILPWMDGRVLPFAQLQRRIGRKTVTQVDPGPGARRRHGLRPARGRRRGYPHLAARAPARGPGRAGRGAGAELPLLASRLRLSPIVEAATWDELADAWAGSREVQAEGLMLKRRSSRLRRRPASRRLVEVEGPAAHDRCRADRRPARQRQARQPLHRLHLRRLGQGHGDARDDRQGVLRA